MPAPILIIDDDTRLGELLKRYLGQFDMSVEIAPTPDDGLRALKQRPPALVVLDVMLPGRDGFQVCREIRALSPVPILMLTARGETHDRIVGLELGADDYLAKPFEPRELAARIQAILRRARPNAPRTPCLAAGPITLDSARRRVFFNGVALELTTNEYEILALFMSRPGAVLSRDDIMDAIRGVEWDAFGRSIDVAISRLRHKLGDKAKTPRFFKTVWGSGYTFAEPVTTLDEPGEAPELEVPK